MAVTKKATISRWIGLSTDTKPTSVPIGSTFYEYDTKLTYTTYDGTNWVILALGYGLIFAGTCNSGMAASTTTIACADLAGYGNDYFNTQFYMQVVKNADSIGAAPDGDAPRKITDYVSSSGTFTVDAFSANVQESDEIYVMHKSVVLILAELPEAGDWALDDYDLFNVADADADNERWNPEYISGAAGGAADINTTTSGKLYIKASYNVAGAERYAVSKNLPIYADFFRVTEDLDITFGATDGATAKAVGIALSKGTAWDATNYIVIERQKGTGVNRIQARSSLNGAAEVTTNVAVTDNAIALKVERLGQTWSLFYSTIQHEEGTEDWQKISEIEDPSNFMTNQVTFYQWAFNGTAGDATETAQGDFDNWYCWLGTGGGGQYIAGDYDSSWVAADIDGSVFERQEALQKAVNVTDAGTLTGFEEDGTGANLFNTLIAVQSVTTGAGTTTTIADTARTEGVDYWNDHEVELLGGVAVGQVSSIVDDDGAGVLTVRPAFTAAPGNAIAYAILKKLQPPVPVADVADNYQPRDVIGNKTDVADYTTGATANSIIALVKGLLGSRVVGEGTFTTSSATVPADTGQGGKATNYWTSQLLIPLAGDVAFQPRLITSFTTTTGVYTMDAQHAFTAATGLVPYVIVANEADLVPAADALTNTTTSHVVGSKTDAIPAMNLAPGTDSLVAHAKAILERLGATPADSDDSLHTIVGQRDVAATADDMSDIATTTLSAKLRLILNRLSTDAFSATIQGAARTQLDDMLSKIADYIAFNGAALNIQVNNQPARSALENALEDFFAVVGCNDANVFNPSIGGSARTDMDAAFAALGTGLGAEFDGTPDLYDTIVTGHDSSAITANHDGSVEERLEAVKDDLIEITDKVEANSLADADAFDWADADGNTERWDAEYISGAEGGSADINTTTAGKAMAKVDPDASPTASGYSLSRTLPFTSKYFAVLVDFDAIFGADTASWKDVNLQVSTGTAYDATNRVVIQKQHQSAASQRFIASAWFNNVAETQYTFSSTDNVAAFKIERWDNVWRVYYSLTQSPDYAWVLLAQYEDPSEFMDGQTSAYIGAYSPGEADAATAQGDFDNFAYYVSTGGLDQEIVGDYDSSAIASDADGSVIERQEWAQVEIAKIPKSDAAVTWNATAAAQIQTEANDALVGQNLDHISALTDGAGNFPNTAVDGSVVSKLISKVGGGDTSSYDETTDSLEMLSDKLGGFSGDGGAAQDDSAKASLDLAHTDLDTIITATDTVETELAKVPKSDAAVTWNATALASVNAEVDTALNTIVPASPTAGSINDILSLAAGANTFVKATDSLEAIRDRVDTLNLADQVDLDAILADTGTDGVVVNSYTDAARRIAGRPQVIEVSVTAAANAGATTIATITTQPCVIDSIVIHADIAQTANLTSCPITGGAANVISFIDAASATQANLNAIDKQVAWDGVVRLAAAKTIVMTLNGTGATAVDLTVTITYHAAVSGGYLA